MLQLPGGVITKVKLKEIFSAKDMTQGSPSARIVEFAIPMLIGNFAQQLYNTADTVIVGKFVGDNALSAVGSASPIMNLLIALFVGIGAGAGIVVSQSFGAKDRTRLSRTIGNCLDIAIISTIFIMILGPLVTMPLLRLLGTPASIIDWCAQYLKIIFIGSAGHFFYNMLSGILRGMGDSFTALGFLLIAAGLNVGLDLLFVSRMGVAGVALATCLSQGISAVLCLIKLMHMRDVFDLNRDAMKLRKENAGEVIRMGVPAGITQAIMSVSMLVVQRLTNSLGETVIACNVIIMRVDGFAMLPNQSFGQAIATFTGQNVGAHKFDRVKKGLRQGLIISLAFSITMVGLMLIFGHYLFGIFTTTEMLIDLAISMMRVMALGYICVTVSQVLGGVMRGAGDTITPMVVSIFTTVCLRVPSAYIIAHLTRSPEYPNGAPICLFLSHLIAWSLGMVVYIVLYKVGRWKKAMARSAARSQVSGGEADADPLSSF